MSKKKRTKLEVELLSQFMHGMVHAYGDCLDDATHRATCCFLADQDEAAKLFRDQLKSFRMRASEANSRLCDLFLESSQCTK